MITLYIPLTTDTKPEFKEISGGDGTSDLDIVMQYAYDLKIYNDALQARIKELENAFGCENCRGNPLTMPMDKTVMRRAAEAVFRDMPEWMSNYKSFKAKQNADVIISVTT
jgi:hypothetical protein